MVTKKQLGISLSKLNKIKQPNLFLEQYTTDSEIASEILWHAYLNNDIENKTIADFGSGNGIFAYGSLMLGAKKIYAIDIDKFSLETAKSNIKDKNVIFLHQDIKDFNKKIDTIIQNPPFGTKDIHADSLFLKKAMQLADNIYSLHKTSTEKFIEKLAEKNSFKIVSRLFFNFPIKHSFKFHKKPVKFVEVTCFVLKRIVLPKNLY